MDIGFIGLGIMGKPMCSNLLNEGIRVHISSSEESTNLELEKKNAIVVDNYTEVVSNSNVVILMLPNSQDVFDVLIKNELYKSLNSKSTIVDMSSITPKMSIEISNILSKSGHKYIDAPVSGGEEKAIEGTLSIMVGGDKEAIEKVKPLLQIMGDSITHMGSVGSGNATKLVNQIIVANNIISLSEGMSLAEELGLDLLKTHNAIKGGLAGSNVMESKIHRIINEDYEPGFKLKLHMKDLNNVFESLNENGLELPITNKTKDIMKQLLEEGLHEVDHGALYKYYKNK